MRLLVCIAFHYNKERFSLLQEVVNTIEKYDLEKKIIIDSNQHFDFEGVEIKTHDSLWHPYQLTWEHRKHMIENLDKFDYFMYIEDDIKLPFENFNQFVDNFDSLWPNFVPSFIRLETREGKEFVTDVIEKQKLENIYTFNGKDFVQLKFPYHGFWILPKKQLSESINHTFYSVSNLREKAASYVWWEMGVKPLVMIDNKKVSEKCYSYHISNKFVYDDSSPFAKIPVDEIFFE